MKSTTRSAPKSDLPVFETRRNVTIVTLPADGIIKPGDVDRVCTIIEEQIDQTPANHDFLLCFKHVQYMSSLFIGRLMGFYKRLAAKQSKLMLCEMLEQLVTVIRLARLERQMPIYPDRAQALTGRTPAVTGIITATALAGIAGVGLLVKIVTSDSITLPRLLAVIYLILNLPLPVMAWVMRRKISSLDPKAQWGLTAAALGLLLLAVGIALV